MIQQNNLVKCIIIILVYVCKTGTISFNVYFIINRNFLSTFGCAVLNLQLSLPLKIPIKCGNDKIHKIHTNKRKCTMFYLHSLSEPFR